MYDFITPLNPIIKVLPNLNFPKSFYITNLYLNWFILEWYISQLTSFSKFIFKKIILKSNPAIHHVLYYKIAFNRCFYQMTSNWSCYKLIFQNHYHLWSNCFGHQSHWEQSPNTLWPLSENCSFHIWTNPLDHLNYGSYKHLSKSPSPTSARKVSVLREKKLNCCALIWYY